MNDILRIILKNIEEGKTNEEIIKDRINKLKETPVKIVIEKSYIIESNF